MLQLKNITKSYKTGDLTQTALDSVNLNLRDNEFVAVLGPSGSGKTTFLNIIGGLDRYDSGDLIINGVSTTNYNDRDWDTYRNHTIGFVFQSYNLIPHQTILANVELALTISGVSRAERKKKAKEALKAVGLEGQFHKKPNQLSGGQMQRVAIARALVNDPEILLADEPTGALDSETSLQIMNLLKEVANDRLVVMVTHNAELAESYATRIVRLKDGKIIDDTDPYYIYDRDKTVASPVKKRRAKMNFPTALSLSFQNLRTKKGRTVLTAFAGSIGIIGIALIIGLSTGVNAYISDIQKDTMGSYPITISAETVNISSLAAGRMGAAASETEENSSDKIYLDYSDIEAAETMLSENNLTAFKEYLDDPDSDIAEYLGEDGVKYTYDVSFSVYAYDPEGALIQAHTPSETTSAAASASSSMSQLSGSGMGMASGMSAAGSGTENFSELMSGSGDEPVGQMVKDNYDLLSGDWPSAYNEVVLVLDEDNTIGSEVLYQLGLITDDTLSELTAQIENGEEVSEISWDYEEMIGKSFYLLSQSDHYVSGEDGLFSYIDETSAEFEQILDSSLELKITGVIRPVEDAENASIETAVAYTSELTDYIIQKTDESAVVQAQEASPETNVLTGIAFEDDNLTDASYESNLESFGKVSYDAPDSISIYTDSFEDKDAVAACIEEYNSTVDEEDQITYTDYAELLTSSITSIINVISYVLIAFVAVSLVVSCIMIGIITHISVMERTKEIGILRALGASKGNISQVFNAETILIGLCSGLLGIGLALLLMVPVNAVIQAVLGTTTLHASLPAGTAVVLILISIFITLIGGLFPAMRAAKKDPVTSLRTE